MQRFNFLLIIGLITLLTSCSKEVKKESIIIEKKLGSQAIEAFNEGKKALEEGDSLFAAKKFNEVETLFPQSDLAPRSLLMAAYAYYFQDYYSIHKNQNLNHLDQPTSVMFFQIYVLFSKHTL